jgi:hypothetical protein
MELFILIALLITIAFIAASFIFHLYLANKTKRYVDGRLETLVSEINRTHEMIISYQKNAQTNMKNMEENINSVWKTIK